MGNQRRSAETIVEAIKMLHEGRIGRVHYSRAWYAGARDPIGQGTPVPVPPNIDYELWQGPAPRQPYTSNLLHWNWHLFWRYGNGEIGNNGVHAVDLSRWGLNVDYPVRVVSSGGRYFNHDDRQTPDTQLASFEFEGDRQITWEGLTPTAGGLTETTLEPRFMGTTAA